MIHKSKTSEFRSRWIDYIFGLQDIICNALSDLDGKESFDIDEWHRDEGKGGGGITRTMSNGNIFEKAGVNTSVVFGMVSEQMRTQLKMESSKWFACGLSLVIHPLNPYVPTVHANWRYFELYDESDLLVDRWFGGGTDLTPYYLFEEDARHFHHAISKAMDPFGEELYPRYKKECDEYFSNKHRDDERRGIGGVFYEHLRPLDEEDAERLAEFQHANGNAFIETYLPIVKRRKDTPYTARESEWQEIRRGRYVEFNLIHDRGTLFGLRTNGRTESILMSLPPRARWIYNHSPLPGSPEDKLLQVCLHPQDWV